MHLLEQPLSLCPLSILPNSHPHWLGPYIKQPKLAKAVAPDCEIHLNRLSIQCRFLDSTRLETSCRTWSKYLSRFDLYSFPLSWARGLPWTCCQLQSTCIIGADRAMSNVPCVTPSSQLQPIFLVAALWHFLNSNTLMVTIKFCIFWSPSWQPFCWSPRRHGVYWFKYFLL